MNRKTFVTFGMCGGGGEEAKGEFSQMTFIGEIGKKTRD